MILSSLCDELLSKILFAAKVDLFYIQIAQLNKKILEF